MLSPPLNIPARPEFGLSLFPENKVRPIFGVRHQRPEALFRKCTGLPPQPPTRTRSARPLFFVFCLHLFTIQL